MTKFNMKDLLIGLTYAAVGLACIGYDLTHIDPHKTITSINAGLLAGGSAWLGGGVLYPFTKGKGGFVMIAGTVIALFLYSIFGVKH